MEYNQKNYTTSKINADIEKNLYNFDYYLQREEGQWNRKAKSLFIDSILRGYIILPIVCDKRDTKTKIASVIEGKQRLTTLRDFLGDKFRTVKELKPLNIDVIVEDENGNKHIETKTYDIADKKFRNFDKELVDILMNYQFTFYHITEATDDEIRDSFIRLNAGKPLTKTQLRKTLMSKELISEIKDIVKLPFLEKKLITQIQHKAANDIDAVAKALLLISADNKTYEIKTFNQTDIENFTNWYNENIDIDITSQLKDAINSLDEYIDDKITIKVTSIPFVLYASYKAIELEKDMKIFSDAIKDFIATYNENTDYSDLIKNGTSSHSSIIKRKEYWDNLLESIPQSSK